MHVDRRQAGNLEVPSWFGPHPKLTISKEKPLPCRAALRRVQSLLKPLVIVTRVIGNDIDHHLDPDTMQSFDELIKLVQGANPRVDIAIVGHII